MIIFTSICTKYVHKARPLAQSVKENIPDAQFYVRLTEREVPESMNFSYFARIILSKDMWNGNFNQFIYKHAIIEASTAVKGQFFRYLLQTHPEENKFIYYYSNEKIDDRLRVKYRSNYDVMFSIEDPFSLSDKK